MDVVPRMEYTGVDLSLAPGERVEVCPYDTSHRVLTARFIRHLDKCRSRYLKEKKTDGVRAKICVCDFNSTHHMPEPELNYHLATCPDRVNTSSGATAGRMVRVCKHFPKVEKPGTSSATSANGEDWDKDALPGYTAGYDPRYKFETTPVVFVPGGMTRSELWAHRELRRKRFDTTRLGIESGDGAVKTAPQEDAPYIPVGAPGWRRSTEPK